MADAIQHMSGAPARRRRKRGLISYKASRQLVPLFYVTPATLLFCLLMLFPMVMVVRYSLMDLAELQERRVFFHAPGGPLLEGVFSEPVPETH